MGREDISAEVLEELEGQALKALVRQAAEGSTPAATGALAAVERIRKTNLSGLHRSRMAELSGRPLELVAYLAGLGQTVEQCAERIGRKLRPEEMRAWKQAEEDRLLEVRAVEIGRMRRGDGDIPRWALRKGT